MNEPAHNDTYWKWERRLTEREMKRESTSLHAPTFMTRAFTVWGRFTVVRLLIALCVPVPLFILNALAR